jgi:hypothetical protein
MSPAHGFDLTFGFATSTYVLLAAVIPCVKTPTMQSIGWDVSSWRLSSNRSPPPQLPPEEEGARGGDGSDTGRAVCRGYRAGGTGGELMAAEGAEGVGGSDCDVSARPSLGTLAPDGGDNNHDDGRGRGGDSSNVSFSMFDDKKRVGDHWPGSSSIGSGSGVDGGFLLDSECDEGLLLGRDRQFSSTRTRPTGSAGDESDEELVAVQGAASTSFMSSRGRSPDTIVTPPPSRAAVLVPMVMYMSLSVAVELVGVSIPKP